MVLRLVVVGWLGLASSAAWAQRSDESVLKDQRVGFKLTVPDGWRLTRQTGFPALLARLSWVTAPETKPGQKRRGAPKATILLSTGTLPPGKGLAAFVARNNRAMAKSIAARVINSRKHPFGGRQAWLVNAISKSGSHQIRQIYLLHRQKVLVLTLRCPTSEAATARPELDRVLEALTFD